MVGALGVLSQENTREPTVVHGTCIALRTSPNFARCCAVGDWISPLRRSTSVKLVAFFVLRQVESARSLGGLWATREQQFPRLAFSESPKPPSSILFGRDAHRLLSVFGSIEAACRNRYQGRIRSSQYAVLVKAPGRRWSPFAV